MRNLSGPERDAGRGLGAAALVKSGSGIFGTKIAKNPLFANARWNFNIVECKCRSASAGDFREGSEPAQAFGRVGKSCFKILAGAFPAAVAPKPELRGSAYRFLEQPEIFPGEEKFLA